MAVAQGVTPEGFNGFDPAAYLPGADPAAAMRSLDELVAFNRRSAKTHSGIWRDLAVRKRRTEVDAQIGIVAELGAQVGVPTPIITRLVALIHDIEDGARPQSLATLDLLVGYALCRQDEQDCRMITVPLSCSSCDPVRITHHECETTTITVIRRADIPFRPVQGDGAAGLSLARLHRPRTTLSPSRWLVSSRVASPADMRTPGSRSTW